MKVMRMLKNMFRVFLILKVCQVREAWYMFFAQKKPEKWDLKNKGLPGRGDNPNLENFIF